MTFTWTKENSAKNSEIAKLRAELEKVGGTKIEHLESMPADIEEQFLRHVLEYETAQPIDPWVVS